MEKEIEHFQAAWDIKISILIAFLNIEPHIVGVTFLADISFFCSIFIFIHPSVRFEPTPLIHCSSDSVSIMTNQNPLYILIVSISHTICINCPRIGCRSLLKYLWACYEAKINVRVHRRGQSKMNNPAITSTGKD